MITLKNNTKSASKIGFLVASDTQDSAGFVYVSLDSTKAIGVVTESVGYREPCKIATIGDTTKVYVGGQIARGAVIRSLKQNDRASTGSCVPVRSTDTSYLRIGEALQAGSGLIPCILDISYVGIAATNAPVSDVLNWSVDRYTPYTVKGAGHFDSGAVNPSNTNRLNWDGNFYATNLYSNGVLVGPTLVPVDDILDWSTDKYAPYAASAAGRLYSGTTNPSDTTRLNYGGYFYATRLYGDVYTDHITEFTPTHGVEIDSILLKDYIIDAQDGVLKHMTITAGDASGVAGTDAGDMYVRAGNAIFGDAGSVAGVLYLVPGDSHEAVSHPANIYLGTDTSVFEIFQMRVKSASTDVHLVIEQKGTGYFQMGNSTGMAILRGSSVEVQSDLLNVGTPGTADVVIKGYYTLIDSNARNTLVTGSNAYNGIGASGNWTGGDLYLLGGQPHGSAAHGNIFIGTGSAGTAPLVGSGTGTSTLLYNRTTGQVTYGDMATPGVGTHEVLSVTHTDTLADTVIRGDIMYGNATPKWARLPFPATPTGKILQATATDIAWSTNPLTIGASASVAGSNTGDQTLSSLGAQAQLNGTGFVKASGTTISYDNSTYLTAVTAHNLLSTTHGDTTAGSCVRGDIITGQGISPTWTKLAIGTTGKVLQSDGTDIGWSANALGSNAYNSTAYLPLAGGTMVGNIIFTDNTYDIGASAATRPRTGYFGTSLVVGSNTSVLGTIKLFGNTSGDVTLQPNAIAGTGIVLTLPALTGTVALTSDIPVVTGFATKALDNLAVVAVNTALLPGTAGALDFGSTAKPWAAIWFAGTSGTPGTNQFKITGASTSGVRIITAPDRSITLDNITTATTTNGTGFLKGNGAVISFDNSTYLTAVTAHNLLSTTHGDTTAAACARGSVIVGDASSKWVNLAFPGTPTGKVLIATATDVAWSASALGTAAYTATGDYSPALVDDIFDFQTNKYTPYAAKSAGKFDVDTVAPSNTNRLNYDGYLYATKLFSSVTTITGIYATDWSEMGNTYARIYSSNTLRTQLDAFPSNAHVTEAYLFDTGRDVNFEGSKLAAFKNFGTDHFHIMAHGAAYSLRNIVTDYNGNVYHTIIIGDQEWIVENLRCTNDGEGTAIPVVSNAVSWAALTTGARCAYDNDINNVDIYGYLYNWYAWNDFDLIYFKKDGIVDIGWRLPTDNDFNKLIEFLGGGAVAGGRMKEMGLGHWTTPNTDAINSSGFTALPGGIRQSDGSYNAINTYFAAWSQELGNWYCSYNDSTAGSDGVTNAKCGLSIRCVRDISTKVVKTATPAFANPLDLDVRVFKNFTPATIIGDCQIRILNAVDGDSGTIHLTVDNTGPHTIYVGNGARLIENSNIVGSNYNEIYINWYADANYVYWYFHEYVD